MSAMSGSLGLIAKSTIEAAKNKIGTDLEPSGGTVAEFSCGSAAEKLRGALIAEVKANAMTLTPTLKFSQKVGVQKPTHFEGKPNEILEASFGGGPFEQAGLALTTIQTDEQKVEVNAVV